MGTAQQVADLILEDVIFVVRDDLGPGLHGDRPIQRGAAPPSKFVRVQTMAERESAVNPAPLERWIAPAPGARVNPRARCVTVYLRP